jgi:hypothetical protein
MGEWWRFKVGYVCVCVFPPCLRSPDLNFSVCTSGGLKLYLSHFILCRSAAKQKRNRNSPNQGHYSIRNYCFQFFIFNQGKFIVITIIRKIPEICILCYFQILKIFDSYSINCEHTHICPHEK